MVKGGEISWKRDRCRGLDYVDYCILNFLGLNFKVENGSFHNYGIRICCAAPLGAVPAARVNL